jgi:hypothetical protein
MSLSAMSANKPRISNVLVLTVVLSSALSFIERMPPCPPSMAHVWISPHSLHPHAEVHFLNHTLIFHTWSMACIVSSSERCIVSSSERSTLGKQTGCYPADLLSGHYVFSMGCKIFLEGISLLFLPQVFGMSLCIACAFVKRRLWCGKENWIFIPILKKVWLIWFMV